MAAKGKTNVVKYALVPESQFKKLTNNQNNFYKNENSFLTMDGQITGAGMDNNSNDSTCLDSVWAVA